MKAVNTEKNAYRQDILVILVISIFLCSPLLSKGFFTAHDIHCHMFKAVATVDALLNGQIPPLIGPRLANGFGYSWNIFYAPLSAYLPAFLKIIIPTFIDSMKLFILLTIFFSGITMYYFALEISGLRNMSLLAAIFYLSAPYRLEDIYIRGAMGESLAFVFIPLFFHGLYNLFYQDGKKDYFIALGFTGLLLSHNISALMCGSAALLYVLLHYKQLLKLRVLKLLVINGFWVIGLSLFYLVPLLEHKVLGNYEVFLPDRMGSLAAMKSMGLYPAQLLFTVFNKAELNFSLGLQLVVPLIFLPFAYKRLKVAKSIAVLLLLGLGSIIVMSRIFPWTLMPDFFSFVQFPWRYLGLAVFFLSIPCAYIIETVSDGLKHKELIILILVIFMYISPLLALTATDPKITDRDYNKIDLITEQSKYSKGSAFFEYMPVKAKADISYLANREDGVILVEGDAQITDEVKDGTSLNFKVKAAADSIIELPYLYYLGWKIGLQTEKGETNLKVHESEKGFVAVMLPAGTVGDIKAEFKGTFMTRITFIFSFLLGILFIVWQLRKSIRLYLNKKRK